MTARTESLLEPRPTPLVPFVALSIGVHVVAALVLSVASWLFAPAKVSLDPPPIKASLVRLGKKRDEKLLPRKEEPPPPPPAAEKAAPAPTPAVPDKAVAIPTKDAKPEPKKDTAKDGAKDAKKSLFDAFNKTARASKAEELEGAEDGDKDGDSARQEGERYFGLISAMVKRNYDVSDTIPEAERRMLRATVKVKLGGTGELLDADLVKASGNDLFDGAVLGAVKKAAPFGPPPEHLRDGLKKDGVSLVFTP
ncbi:MAG: TonB C-terminal domain-containing protein [Myxococcaceae bacterium]|jgi:TonB family protein|nr:TonB C-terminal domain-containing protein [Myxococcaceae bacterium]